MSFYLFLVVVVSLSCGSIPAWGETSQRAVWASIAMVSGWSLLAGLAARVMSRQVLMDQMSLPRAGRVLEIQLEALRWLALPVIVVCLGGFGLAAWVREVPGFDRSLLLQSLVLLAPGLLILAATWSAEVRFGAAIGLVEASWSEHFRTIFRYFRGGPAWLIGPTLLFLALGDVLSWIEMATDQTWLISVVAVVGGSLLVVFLPRLVQSMIQSEPVEPGMEREIQTWLNRCGISTHPRWGTRIVRWNTGHRTINAMVAGFVPWGRMLLLSDRILDELPRNQLLLVVMHEVAHARRWHILLRMAAVIPAYFASTALDDWAVLTSGDESWGPVAGGVGGLVTTILCLGVIAYITELDADRVACRLAKKALGADHPLALDPDFAARSMGDALIRVTAEHPASRRASWLHPSLAMRLRSLGRSPASPVTTAGTYSA